MCKSNFKLLNHLYILSVFLQYTSTVIKKTKAREFILKGKGRGYIFHGAELTLMQLFSPDANEANPNRVIYHEFILE